MTPFGLASTVFRARALGAPELDLAASSGFTQIEIVAAPGHFDVTSAADVANVRTAAAASGVSVVALTSEPAAALAALDAAATLSCPLVVVRTRACAGARLPAVEAADTGVVRKLLDNLAPRIPAGVRIAIDFPAWPSLTTDELIDFLEGDDAPRAGVCLDAGHAALAGSAVDAAEELSGFLASVRLHDNQGREDSHRLPWAGTVDWPAVITSCWKAGFTGPWILAPMTPPDSGIDDVLRRAVGARTRLQGILEDLAQPFTFAE
jgi:sugar phosphate isomerase/epimerase